MKKVVSIVLNNFTSDNRVLKENLSLKKSGFQVMIIAMHNDGLEIKEEIEGIPVHRIKVKSKNWLKSFILSAFNYFEFLYKAIRLTEGFNFIHCNDLETLAIGYFRKKLTKNVKIIYDCHEYEIERNTNIHKYRKWLNKKMENYFIHSADSVITVSDSIADEYVRLYQIKRPELIFNCPPKQTQHMDKQNIFREKFNLKEDQKIFLYQGGFTSGRGLEVILETFSKLNDQHVIVFMGWGKLESIIKEYAEKNNNIFYHKGVPFNEILKHTKSADWGLITTEYVNLNNYMSLPNKLFEYVQADLPTIAFPMMEIKAKINSYNIGIITENESSEALTKAVISTDEIDTSIYKDGIEKMKEEFNWESQEKKLIHLYESLL